MMLAFGYTANAQQRKATAPVQQQASVDEAAVKTAAAKDVKALGEFIDLTSDQQTAFKGLFEYKHRLLAENLSQERKDILAEQIELKIKATVSPDQVGKLDENPKLMNILTH